MALSLDLRHYETLLAIADLGSLTAAAERLHVSQSALSHRLAEAERRLGLPLFDRGAGRQMRPTSSGLALVQAAERIIPDLERVERDVLLAASSAIEIVRIGVGSYDCYHWLPAFHAHLTEHEPTLQLELAIVGDSPAAPLGEGRVDVVLAPGIPQGQFRQRPVLTDELVLVVHPDHRLAGQDWIEAEQLADDVYLTYSKSPAPGFEFERFVRPANPPRTVTVIEQPNAILQMVAAGLGVSILSRWSLGSMMDDGKIVAVQCGPEPLTLEWYALLRATSPVGSSEDRVAALLDQWLSRDQLSRDQLSTD